MMRNTAIVTATLVWAGSASAFILPMRQANKGARFAPLYSDGNPPPFGNWGAAAAPAAPAVPAAVTVPAPSVVAAPVPSAASIDSGDPIATLAASQGVSVQQILSAIPDLASKPDLSWLAGEVSIAGCTTATLSAYDAPGSSNVAWLADVCMGGKLSSLTIFNGPLTDVPHLLSRCCVTEDSQSLQVAIDFRPRAYGAYEMIDPATGNYPGPEELGRKAFEYSGARNDFFTKFGTDELKALLDPAQFDGATAMPPTELDRLTGSPLALHVSMPMSAANLAKVVVVREQVAAAWLEWALQRDIHANRPGAPVNTQYVYDSKFRQNAYIALLPYYSAILGAQDGTKLAQAESGPLDEGYVGGGS